MFERRFGRIYRRTRLSTQPGFAIEPAYRAGHRRRRRIPVGDSSTVEQRTLTPLILVRIQVPQPTIVLKSKA